jgi:hypothetical protein
MKLPKELQDEFSIQEACYALRQGNEYNKRQFVIPYSNTLKGSKDTLTELTHEHLQLLNSQSLCTNGVLLTMQQSGAYWVSIKHSALGVGAAMSHSNSGRKHQLDDVYNPVAAFISVLEAYGKTRATRKVSNFAGVANCDEEVGSVYLPMNMSICNCWAQYMDGIGYDVKTSGDGNYRVKGQGEGSQVLYASLMTFYSIWK